MGWIILLLVTMLIAYLLFAPFFIEIDSERGLYGFRFHRLASVIFVPEDSSIFMEMRIAGWHKRMDLLGMGKGEKRLAVKRTEKKKVKRISMQTVKNIIRTFKINRLYANLDTGDMALNGILFPAFYFLGRWTGKGVYINFTGENKVILQVENNLARIAWAFLKYQK